MSKDSRIEARFFASWDHLKGEGPAAFTDVMVELVAPVYRGSAGGLD
jgi:hypothetical protein